jgi:hypothetical protein
MKFLMKCLLLASTTVLPNVVVVAQAPQIRIPDKIGGYSETAPRGTANEAATVTLGDPDYDPYASPGTADNRSSSFFDGWGSHNSTPANSYGSSPPPGQPLYGSNANPTSLFPNGLTVHSGIGGTPVRFVRGPRFRHSWIAGDNGREMDINDSDISFVVTYPNFLFSGQPIYIAPSFSLHLWDNPSGPPDFPALADLPSKAYSAFLDTKFETDPDRIFGVEVMGRIGIFSDFSTMTSDSLRVAGGGNLKLRLTDTMLLKGGAFFTDRLKVKLIPAGGILWEPNDRTRFDIYFPKPKLASYLSTIGNNDVWWYIAGEYGGGSWTVKRGIAPILTDRYDQNDIRLIVGLEWGPSEWFREGRRIGFIETGWVTDREGIFYLRPQDDFSLRDSFMLRAGIGY